MKKPGNTNTDTDKLEDLARRFQDLWRDQMAATAADPEFTEMMGKWMGALTGGAQPPGAPPFGGPAMPGSVDPAAWMEAMRAAMTGAGMEGGADDGNTGAAKAGAKAAAAASGAGDVAGDKLERRLAGLEERLERLEAALGDQGGGPAKRTRRRKS